MGLITATQMIELRLHHGSWAAVTCDDGHRYIVEGAKDRREAGRLCRAYLGSRLLRSIGVPSPECMVVRFATTGHGISCIPGGPYCGFRDLRTPDCDLFKFMAFTELAQLNNPQSFAGAFAFDLWCNNVGSRKVIFTKRYADERYDAYFVGHRHCFGDGCLDRSDYPEGGIYHRRVVYSEIRGVSDFEPYLERIWAMDPQRLYEIVNEVPAQWVGDEKGFHVDALVAWLLRRRMTLCNQINEARDANPGLFPSWRPRHFVGESVKPARLRPSQLTASA